jgi:hypothetical protein
VSLREALDRIRDALQKGHFQAWSVYGIGADGFGVVAQMETIDDLGRPLAGDKRWLPDPPLTLSDGLLKILQRLASAERGRYRVIALLLTPRQLTADTSKPSESVERLPDGGPQSLPPSADRQLIADSTHFYALVYEFVKIVGAAPRWVPPNQSGLSAREHVALSGIWSAKDLE